MKISVITTCYNRKNSIASAIESVLSQDYPNVEYVIVDGASSDGSVDIIRSYQDKFTRIVSESDTGIYNALNKGIRLCTGEVIGLLHSDDMFYSTDTLSEIAAVFERTGADIVYADGQYVDEQDTNTVKRIYPGGKYRKWKLYFGWIPLHTTIFVKKEVFDRWGLYREDFRIASDYEISLRWFTNDSLKKAYINKWMVKMRLGGKSTDMQQQKRKSAEDLQIIREYRLWGYVTLFFKIARKIPQYVLPKLKQYPV